jgi:hypothetical protein
MKTAILVLMALHYPISETGCFRARPRGAVANRYAKQLPSSAEEGSFMFGNSL